MGESQGGVSGKNSLKSKIPRVRPRHAYPDAHLLTDVANAAVHVDSGVSRTSSTVRRLSPGKLGNASYEVLNSKCDQWLVPDGIGGQLTALWWIHQTGM